MTELNYISIFRALAASPGALLSGIVIYIVLSNLFVPDRITLPLSIIMSVLIFGLTNYYSGENAYKQDKSATKDNYQTNSLSNFVFIGIYIILIFCAFKSHQSPELFSHWHTITFNQLATLVASILLSSFVPGYAIINILDRRGQLELLPRALLAYLLSILLTGLAEYLPASLGFTTIGINVLVGLVNIVIVGVFVYVKAGEKKLGLLCSAPNMQYLMKFVKENLFELLVFSSLLSLVIVSTYYLYDGTIIGDQWYHHGRAYIFTSGVFKEVSHIEDAYPPFQHAFLATFFSLSNVPSVNTYVSINIFNIVPVFAFYYFFSKWLPNHRKVALMASTLFMLSSGFGWAYLLYLSETHNISSPIDSFSIFQTAIAKTFDILTPNTFIDVSNPSITTGLIIIGLPAGFVLLGMIKENMSNKFVYTALLAAIAVLGYLAHDEFGVFGIIAPVMPLFFGLPGKNSVFAAVLAALSIVVFAALFFPGQLSLANRGIEYNIGFGTHKLSLFVAYFLFTLLMWAAYASHIITKVRQSFEMRFLPKLKAVVKGRVRLVLAITLIFLISYVYILSFVIWNFQIPFFNIFLNTKNLTVVPWNLYPLRFGVTGLLGLCLILSYLFKRFEKEVFVFGIIAIIPFFLGPYYDELRFNKYIMAGMAGFGSLMLYRILSVQKSLKKPLINGLLIGLVITSSSFSVLLYLGYVELGTNVLRNNTTNPIGTRAYALFDIFFPLSSFPSDSEMRLLQFLRNNLNLKADNNIALPEKEMQILHGLNSKIVGFVGLPLTKMFQSPLTLQESSLEGLYTLLNYTHSKFIVLPKQFIHNGLSEVLRFALENFKRVYEDDNYIVLSVPALMPPSSVGNVAIMSNQSGGDNNNSYYYSLSALALSNTRYNNYAQADLSAFSKKNVILTFDPVNTQPYVGFIKNGGNIIVINSKDDFKGGFSNLLCIQQHGGYKGFDNIVGNGGQHIGAFGVATPIELSCPGATIKSFYVSHGQDIAPFVINAHYGNGNIIFVNAFGYFTAISRFPHQFFLNLANFPSLIGLSNEEFTKNGTLNAAPFPYLVGSLNMSGQVRIKGPSLLLPTNSDFYAEKVLLRNNKVVGIHHQSTVGTVSPINLNNVRVINLKLSGKYNVLVNSTNFLYSPSRLVQYGYFPLEIPFGSNMTVKLFNGSSAEFFRGIGNQPIKLTGDSEIEFIDVKQRSLARANSSIPVLMKSPTIAADKVSFQQVRSNNPSDLAVPWGDTFVAPLPLHLKQRTILELDHTTFVPTNNQTVISMPAGYVTYFKWLEVHANTEKPPIQQGNLLDIPWQQVIKSDINVIAIVTTLIIAVVLLYICSSSQKGQVKLRR